MGGVAASRFLFEQLVRRELRQKYQGSVLGLAWYLINPLVLMAAYWFLFGVVLEVFDIEDYPLFLLCGLLPWAFLSNGITGSIGALVSNANLVKKVYFPREVLIGANVLSWVVSLLI